jgi:hypothetical protein
MIDEKISDVRSGYDVVAEEYARRIYDELQHKPLDCRLLDRFAESVRNEFCLKVVGVVRARAPAIFRAWNSSLRHGLVAGNDSVRPAIKYGHRIQAGTCMPAL